MLILMKLLKRLRDARYPVIVDPILSGYCLNEKKGKRKMHDLPMPNGITKKHAFCFVSKWKDDMKDFRLIRNIALFLLILVLNIGVYIGYQKGYSYEDIWGLISGFPIIAVFSIIGLYCLKTVVWVIPIYALYIGAGFLLPV